MRPNVLTFVVTSVTSDVVSLNNPGIPSLQNLQTNYTVHSS